MRLCAFAVNYSIMKTIRWGIIGCGDVCEVKSGPALQKANNSALVAVMRRDAEKAADFAARHGVPFSTGSAREVIEHPEVDAVYVATPPENVAGIARNSAAHRPPLKKVEDSIAMSFTASGVPATASWNFASFSRADRIEIFGTEGKISLSCFGSDDVRLESARGLQTFNGKLPPHMHQGLVQTIVDELNGQGRALSSGATALRTMEVMDAVLVEYYGGRDDVFWNRPLTWPGTWPKIP